MIILAGVPRKYVYVLLVDVVFGQQEWQKMRSEAGKRENLQSCPESRKKHSQLLSHTGCIQKDT